MKTPQTSRDATDPLLLRRLGGPVGQHARRVGLWFTAGPWVMGAALVMWLLTWARTLPCHRAHETDPARPFNWMCYSDISTLYQSHELAKGVSPFTLEYPVLTNLMIDVGRMIARLLGAPTGEGLTPQQVLDSSNLFVAVTTVLLFVCFLVTLWAQVRTTPHRPFDALMVAVAPAVLLTGLINWDMLVVMFTALGFLAWRSSRPTTAGVFWGLGVAAKLYPILVFVPIVLLAFRAGRLRAAAKSLAGAVVAWGLPNVAVYLMAPEAWAYFWTFNADRKADLGSVWYVLSLMGVRVQGISSLQAFFMVLGALLLTALVVAAPRRPRLGQMAFLMLVWFLLVNKVYSPQYVLWLLPLVVLARPVWRDWVIWGAGEAVYSLMIWGHLAQSMLPVDTTQDRWYWLAVAVRVAAQLYLVRQVVRDVLDPRRDVLRADGHDDPHGGVFDGAPDSPWFRHAALLLGGPVGTTAALVSTDVHSNAALRQGQGTGPAQATSAGPANAEEQLLLGTMQPPLALVDVGEVLTIRHPMTAIMGAWSFTRLMFLLAAVTTASAVHAGVAEVMGHWDVEHFVAIATNGYVDKTDPAFFPGLPVLLAAGHAIGLPFMLTGTVLSLVCSALAALALYRLGGRDAGPWAALFWLAAPMGVFTFLPYTESLFCALAFWAWERARARAWWQMAVLAALACTVRVSGLFLIGALAILIVSRVTEGTRRLSFTEVLSLGGERGRADGLSVGARLAPLAWLLLPVAALVGYAAFGKARFGSWTAWYTAQTTGWSREFHWPWEALLNTLTAAMPGAYADHPGWALMFRGELLSVLVGLIAVVLLCRRRRWAEGAWIAVQLLAFSMSYWFMSVNRAVLLWFPLWLLLGEWVTARQPVVQRRGFRLLVVVAAVLCSLLLGLGWAWSFYVGRWAS